MKRYYDKYGEPDVAKTLWAFLTKCLWVLAIFCGIALAWNKTHQPTKREVTSHWKNWDNNGSLSEVKWYDYENGIIHYREDGEYIPRELPRASRGYFDDGIVIRADGVSIHTNMSAEELLDQLTEEADFYEYFERNVD